MFQNLLYDVFILNKADNLHGSLALRAGERINLPPEEKPYCLSKALFIDLFKCLKMVFNTPIIRGILRIARPVDKWESRSTGMSVIRMFPTLIVSRKIVD